MESLLQIGLANLIIAAPLMIVAYGVGRIAKRPALAHGLWLLVLLKLITPPLIVVPVPWAQSPSTAKSPSTAVDGWAQSPRAVDGSRNKAHRLRSMEQKTEYTLPQDALGKRHAPSKGVQTHRHSDADTAVAYDEPKEKKVDVAGGPHIQKTETQSEYTAHSNSIASLGEFNSCVWHVVTGNVVEWLKKHDVFSALGILWIVGSFTWFSLAFIRIVRFLKLLRYATPAPESLQTEAYRLGRHMGLSRCPGVWLVPGAVSPMLWTIGRSPRLLIPKELLQQLDDEQRATLLVHELAHYYRMDHWVRYLELLVLGLYWWCPLVWWTRRELNQAEEECCDAWVVWVLPSSARAYANALVDTLDFLSNARSAVPLAASGLGQVYLLRRRLSMIMRGKTPRMLSRVGLFGLLGAGVLLLPLLPGFAQDDRRPKGDDRKPDKNRKEIEEVKRALHELHKDFEQQRRQFEQRAKQLHDKLRDLGFRGPPFPRGDRGERPDDRKPPRDRERPDFRRPPGGERPDGGPGRPDFRPPGGDDRGGNLERRLHELERKIEMILRRLEGRPFDRERPDNRPNPFGRPRRGENEPNRERPGPPRGEDDRNRPGPPPGGPPRDDFRPRRPTAPQPPRPDDIRPPRPPQAPLAPRNESAPERR